MSGAVLVQENIYRISLDPAILTNAAPVRTQEVNNKRKTFSEMRGTKVKTEMNRFILFSQIYRYMSIKQST